MNGSFTCGNCKANLGLDSPGKPGSAGTLHTCKACKDFELYLDGDLTGKITGVIISYTDYELVLVQKEKYFKVYKLPLGTYMDEPPSFEVPIPPLEFNVDYHEITEEFITLLASYS